jgi:hypothetical protein
MKIFVIIQFSGARPDRISLLALRLPTSQPHQPARRFRSRLHFRPLQRNPKDIAKQVSAKIRRPAPCHKTQYAAIIDAQLGECFAQASSYPLPVLLVDFPALFSF